MRNTHGRMVVLVLVMLGIASPAAAQFGGLKKKLKSAAGQEAAAEGQKAAGVSDAPAAAQAAPAGNPGRGGGAVVVTPEGVDHLISGLRAAEVYRQTAIKEDTPYGRYVRAAQAYKDAKVTCENAQQGFITRMQTDEKLQKRYQEIMDKMTAAMEKSDREAATGYQLQALALVDPACAVQEPQQPDGFYDAQRDVDAKAEQTATKSSGLTTNEYYWINERTGLILYGNPPPDISASEKSAVNAKAAELKSLLGIQDQPTERAKKPAPAPQPVPAQAAPDVPPGTADMSNCMVANAQKHEKEIVALGERAKATQEAGDMAATMAIADTLRQIQMAGCSMPQGQ
ncbi:MAG: hypothetical protein ACREOQ_15275 [Gemmatimonadales bacterium]